MSLDLTTGSCRTQILRFSVPLLISSLFSQLYTMVDSVVVGRMVGKGALAAVGTATPVVFLILGILAGFVMGTSVIASQLFGAKDMPALRRAVSTAFYVVMGLSVIMTMVGLVFAENLLVLLKTPPDVLGDALIYIRWVFASVVFQCLYQFPAAVLRGIGDSKTPLYFLILSALLNIVLDVVFVLWMDSGVAAVAIATLVAQAVASVACLWYTFRKYDFLRFTPRELIFDRAMFKKVVAYGVPSSVAQVVASLGMMFMQGLVNGFGTDAMAAFSAAYKIDNFLMLPIANLGTALAGFVGQNLGAQQPARIREGFRETVKLCTGFSIVAGAVIFVACPLLMLIFVQSSETEVIRMGSECLRVLAVPFFVCGLYNCYVSFFRGVGDNRFVMAISMTQIAVRVTIAYVLCSIPAVGILGVWLCMPGSWVVTTTICTLRYRKHKAEFLSVS